MKRRAPTRWRGTRGSTSWTRPPLPPPRCGLTWHSRRRSWQCCAAELALRDAGDACGAAGAWRDAGRCGVCGVTNQAALLSHGVRCDAPRCTARCHFVCAGYAVALANPSQMTWCRGFDDRLGLTADDVERADREVALLKAHLAARRASRSR